MNFASSLLNRLTTTPTKTNFDTYERNNCCVPHVKKMSTPIKGPTSTTILEIVVKLLIQYKNSRST